MRVVSHPLLVGKIVIAMPLSKDSSADEIAAKLMSLIGQAQTLVSSYILSVPRQLTGRSLRLGTPETVERIWSDFSKTGIELTSIADRARTLTSSFQTMPMIYVDNVPSFATDFFAQLLEFALAFAMDYQVESGKASPDYWSVVDAASEMFE